MTDTCRLKEVSNKLANLLFLERSLDPHLPPKFSRFLSKIKAHSRIIKKIANLNPNGNNDNRVSLFP
jgi:hypothetical protein